MDWKSLKMIVVSTLTAVVISQAVRKVYKTYFKKPKEQKKDTKNAEEKLIDKSFHDVIMYNNPTDYIIKDLEQVDSNPVPIIQNQRKLISYIRKSKETLDICMYLISNTEIAEHVIRLGRKHVLIRVIVNEEMIKIAQSQIKRLKEYSFIAVQESQESFIHHKFCVVDGPASVKRKYKLIQLAQKQHKDVMTKVSQERVKQPKTFVPFVMTGSLNCGYKGQIGSLDNVIITSQPQIVHKYEKEFSKLWNEIDTVTTKL